MKYEDRLRKRESHQLDDFLDVIEFDEPTPRMTVKQFIGCVLFVAAVGLIIMALV